MPWVGYLAAALVGVLLGWLLAAVVIRRVDGPRADTSGGAAALAADVVAGSDSGYAVTDRAGNFLLANQRARDLQVVRAGMPDKRVSDAIARTAVSGEPVDVDLGQLEPAGDRATDHGASVIHAIAQPLGDDLILVTAIDESEARRVEAIRRDFVANVSHELKTPVGAIALLAEAVLDGADEPEAVRYFAGKMLAESTRLGALVSELIALSRLQGGLRLDDLAMVEVDRVVDESVARVAMPAEAANITVIRDAPSQLMVRGDRTLLVTALTNLIDNAISYSPRHTTVSVTRSAHTEDSECSGDGRPPGLANFVDIAVTDRGIGIAPEHQQRVFERFFRVDPARSRATGGTGLGLAIVKHIAANHGGQALLWSRTGTGSTFTLRLPQTQRPAADRQAVEPSTGHRNAGQGTVSAAPQTPTSTAAQPKGAP